MVKYMKKSNATGDVPMTEVSPSSVGVRPTATPTTPPASNSHDSCGEVNSELKVTERSTQELETTALSLIVALARDAGATPGTNRQAGSTAAGQCEADALHIDVPSESEMDEFFDRVEKLQQRSFIDKYNFDFVNEFPLPGRYEWVKLNPGAE